MEHKRILLAAMGLLALVTSSAPAAMHHFSLSNALYRSEDGGALTSVPFSIPGSQFPGLGFDPTGTLWGSRTDGANRAFYTIDPMTGAATFEFDYSTVQGIVSFDFRQNGGVLELFGMAGDTLLVYNAATGALISSNNYGLGFGFPSTAYDPSSETYYGFHNGTDTLYTLPFAGPAVPVAPATGVGDYFLASGAWFSSEYWSGFYDSNTNTVKLGTLDTMTGAYSEEYSFTAPVVDAAMGYAIIPEPTTLCLLVLGGTALRRRGR